MIDVSMIPPPTPGAAAAELALNQIGDEGECRQVDDEMVLVESHFTLPFRFDFAQSAQGSIAR